MANIRELLSESEISIASLIGAIEKLPEPARGPHRQRLEKMKQRRNMLRQILSGSAQPMDDIPGAMYRDGEQGDGSNEAYSCYAEDELMSDENHDNETAGA